MFKVICMLLALSVLGTQGHERAPGPAVCATTTGQPCQFPFIYKEITFHHYTYYDTDDKAPWCATAVDPTTRNALPDSWHNSDLSLCWHAGARA